MKNSKLKGPACKPQLLVCYLCGQQFGHTSLSIHVPQCYDKKLKQWQVGDPATRGKKPRDPGSVNWQQAEGTSVQEFNDMQFKDFSQNLEPCPNCGRKFLSERLVVHLRSCNSTAAGGGSKPIGGKGASSPTAADKPGSASSSRGNSPKREKLKGPAYKPQLLVCYLCGQQFGHTSLSIHVPQCYDKKLKQWQVGDPATRGKKPRDPGSVNWQQAEGTSVQEFNDMQFKDFSQNLEPCPNCGRKFLSERLVVHLRSCNSTAAGGGSKPIGGKGASSPTAADKPGSASSSRGNSPKREKLKGPACKPQLFVCYLCGQQFGSSSLGIHVPQCYDKKVKQWEVGDPDIRGKKPRHPDTVAWQNTSNQNKDEYNDQQFKDFSNNLEPCSQCGRKFLPDRLVVHLRSCNGTAVGGGSKPVLKAGSPTNKTSPISPSSPTGKREGISLSLLKSSSPGSASMNRLSSTERSQPMKNRLRTPSPQGSEPPPRTCAQCQSIEYDGTAKFCRDCGTILPIASEGAEVSKASSGGEGAFVLCFDCGEKCSDKARICSTCGAMVNEAIGTRNAGEKAAGVAEDPARSIQTEKCPNCEVEVEEGSNFCDNCGCRLGVEAKRPPTPTIIQMMCVSCGEILEDSAKFCEECGEELVPTSMKKRRGSSPSCDPGQATLPPLNDKNGAADSSGASVANSGGESRASQRGQKPSSSCKSPRSPMAAKLSVSIQNDNEEEEDQGDYSSEGRKGTEFVGDRTPCSYCGRQFAIDTLERHENFCAKQQQKKRKVFDSRKLRMQGSEAAAYVKKVEKMGKEKPAAPAKPNWKEKSKAFREAMKAARQVDKVIKSGGDVRNLPPPTYSENPDYICCPSCGRRFNEKAAERHIPNCAKTVNKPKPPPKRR